MTTFAPNVTARYRLHYNVVGRNHTMQCRGVRGVDVGTLVADGAAYLRAVFAALAANLCDDLSFISAEYALTDSDLFFPAAVPTAVVGLNDLATFSKQDSITHLTFSGRGSFGSKANLKLYGCQFDPDNVTGDPPEDFVITSAEYAPIATAIAALNTSPGGRIVAIDNSPAAYHARATLKVNDYWLRRVRQGL